MMASSPSERLARFLASGDHKPEPVPGTPRVKRARRLTPYEAGLASARARAESGEWDGATGDVLLGLYAHCHEIAYRILPGELESEWAMAAKRVRQMLGADFLGNADAMVEFIKWTWLREQRRNGSRANQGDFRIGWRFQFSASMLTDWRVANAAKKR